MHAEISMDKMTLYNFLRNVLVKDDRWDYKRNKSGHEAMSLVARWSVHMSSFTVLCNLRHVWNSHGEKVKIKDESQIGGLPENFPPPCCDSVVHLRCMWRKTPWVSRFLVKCFLCLDPSKGCVCVYVCAKMHVGRRSWMCALWCICICALRVTSRRYFTPHFCLYPWAAFQIPGHSVWWN
jgi:hypothetical protein